MKIYFYEMRSGMERCKKEKKHTFLCGDCKKREKVFRKLEDSATFICIRAGLCAHLGKPKTMP